MIKTIDIQNIMWNDLKNNNIQAKNDNLHKR
jgi:hypothetical protein